MQHYQKEMALTTSVSEASILGPVGTPIERADFNEMDLIFSFLFLPLHFWLLHTGLRQDAWLKSRNSIMNVHELVVPEDGARSRHLRAVCINILPFPPHATKCLIDNAPTESAHTHDNYNNSISWKQNLPIHAFSGRFAVQGCRVGGPMQPA